MVRHQGSKFASPISATEEERYTILPRAERPSEKLELVELTKQVLSKKGACRKKF